MASTAKQIKWNGSEEVVVKYAVKDSHGTDINISAITDLIPSQATSSNKLADQAFVNSSISTNTANFIGTFANVSALASYSGTVTNNDYAIIINSVITNNGSDWTTFAALDAYDKTLLTNFDYAWVVNGSKFDLYRFDIMNQTWGLRVSNTNKADVTLNTAYNRYKAVVSNSTVTWYYEFTINSSSFTAAQWAAINSGATSALIGEIPTAAQKSTWNGKQDALVSGTNIKSINGVSILGSGSLSPSAFDAKSVSDNTITELDYDIISIISKSANTTFTLKAAVSGTIPEYRAKITNSGSSAIDLTFPVGTIIQSNDDEIAIVSNVLTLPAGTTIEMNLFDNHLIAYNWAI